MSYIKLQSVNVDFPIYNAKSRSLRGHILSTIGGRIEQSHDRVVVRALSNINLEINEGDRVAVIGHNGAGKTTLLRVLSGIYEPTAGSIEIKGKISSLTDIQLGMDADATGYENILLRGIFMGMTPKEIEQKAEGIIQFAALEEFINMPLRTYSSGMYLRLAFAVSTCIEPEILILDEMIGVGDKNFMEKAKQRVSKLIGQSKIMILSSHDTSLLQRFCNKAIYMKHGEIMELGNINNVIEKFTI